MKIIIIHFGRKGAGPAISYEMAKSLHHLGHTIFYYASADVENRTLVEKEVFEKRFFSTYKTKLSYLISAIFQKEIKKVIVSIKKDNPDVVYSTMNDLWAPFLFPKLKGFLRVKTIHDVDVHEGNESVVNKWWNNTNFKDAERFVVLSNKFVSKLEDRGIRREDIVVIPHAGFDYYLGIGVPRQDINSGKKILFFGRIDKYKGIDILLAAMPYVVKKHPDVKLTIVGNGDIGRYFDALESYKSVIELHNRWIKDEEVAGFVSACDFVVLPYTHATQSGVIPLAYAFSKPVVATRVGCLDEQVVEGKTGVMCEGRDVMGLAQAIIYMLDNPSIVKEMGEYSNEYMRKYLTWDSSATKLVNFLKLSYE